MVAAVLKLTWLVTYIIHAVVIHNLSPAVLFWTGQVVNSVVILNETEICCDVKVATAWAKLLKSLLVVLENFLNFLYQPNIIRFLTRLCFFDSAIKALNLRLVDSFPPGFDTNTLRNFNWFNHKWWIFCERHLFLSLKINQPCAFTNHWCAYWHIVELVGMLLPDAAIHWVERLIS